MDETMTGIVRSIIDCGSVVQVFIETIDPETGEPSGRTQPWAADGNMWRFGGAADACGVGTVVEFDMTDWGGLASIAPAPDHPTAWQYATQRQEA